MKPLLREKQVAQKLGSFDAAEPVLVSAGEPVNVSRSPSPPCPLPGCSGRAPAAAPRAGGGPGGPGRLQPGGGRPA